MKPEEMSDIELKEFIKICDEEITKNRHRKKVAVAVMESRAIKASVAEKFSNMPDAEKEILISLISADGIKSSEKVGDIGK